jgi:hypothetical protein
MPTISIAGWADAQTHAAFFSIDRRSRAQGLALELPNALEARVPAGCFSRYDRQRMYSHRFGRPVVITRHAAQRMAARAISPELLLEIVDTGATRYRDATRLWAWLRVDGRHDNLLCVALVLEDVVVVKTVMHHWETMP